MREPNHQLDAVGTPAGSRPAFTLIELMATVVIIAILSAVFLGALQQAQRAAQIARTQSLIAKLHTQLLLRWESYRTRRVNVAIPASADSKTAAKLRLFALRELMTYEMPDRWSDVVDITSTSPVTLAAKQSNLQQPPAIAQAFLRRFQLALNTSTLARVLENEDAELLYLIVTQGAEDDTLGAEQFSPADIGDIDEDGLPEFHDAWNQPVRFLRWAPSFYSDLQPAPPTGSNPERRQHDPFDPANADPLAFKLVPLIYSHGPDRFSDIVHDPSPGALLIPRRLQPSAAPTIGAPSDTDNDGDDTGSLDNIHNHLIGMR